MQSKTHSAHNDYDESVLHLLVLSFFSIENILKVQKAVPESAVTKCQALSFKGVESTKESLVVKFRFYL